MWDRKSLALIAVLVILLACSILSACVKTPPAITTGSLFGSLQTLVTDANGSPLAGVKVVSNKQPEGQLKVTGITGDTGLVTFNDIRPGDYTFYVSRFDYVQRDRELKVVVNIGQTTDVTVVLVKEGEAADDIINTPGGPTYRANVQQQGVANPWPPVMVTSVTQGTGLEETQITYRANIESNVWVGGSPVKTYNNLITVLLPNLDPANKNILQVFLKPVNLPVGITATQTDLQWHGADAGRRVTTALTIQISTEVIPGTYTFNIGLEIGGSTYNAIPCTITVQ